MKKLIKYRVCAMLILIVLMFSFVPVQAIITDPPSNVEGDGSEENPYVIDLSSGVGTKIVLQPESVPFNFIVKADGALGGIFAIDYDVQNNLVSFTLTETVDENTDTAKLYNSSDETVPRYTINQTLKCLSYGTHTAQPVLKQKLYSDTQILTNVDAKLTVGASSYKKDDLYLFVCDPQIDFKTYEHNDMESALKSPTSDLSILKKTIEALNYEYRYLDSNSSWFTKDSTLYFEKLKANGDRAYKFVEVWVHEVDGAYVRDVAHGGYKEVTLAAAGISKPVTVMYTFNGKNVSSLGGDTQAGTIENIITRIFMFLGDGILLNMLQGLFGTDLTINSLIFNQYEKTKLSFYSSSYNDLSEKVANVVNAWYKIFMQLAYILYIIILVYIAIMIVVSAGTPEQDKNKKNLGNWFAGLAIMTVVPTLVIPSLIKLNDAFVKFMYNKSGTEITTYYNTYLPDGIDNTYVEDIIGGDSSTVSIKELTEAKEEAEKGLKEKQQEIAEKSENVYNNLMKDIELNYNEEMLVTSWFSYSSQYINYNFERSKEGSSSGGALNNCHQYIVNQIFLVRRIDPSGAQPGGTESSTLMRQSTAEKIFKVISSSKEVYEPSDGFKELYGLFEERWQIEQQIKYIEAMIEVQQSDLMTIMRTYAGETGRIIFAVVWYSLLFQFIAMIFIYYKRIFVIAILITIFPLIMIFYCIDKMADGSAQTLSMWFKELIANIFIQSVHCVIYTVLVEMGLEIYRNDPNNWFLFLAAMLLLVPAERMLKDIFGLNGSTLGQLGGMGTKVAAGIGSAMMLAKMGLRKAGNAIGGKKNKAVVDAANKRFNKLQKRQNKSDLRSERRGNRQKKADLKHKQRIANGEKGLGAAIKNGAYKAGTAARKLSDKAHEKATARREKQASKIPKKAAARARRETAKEALKVAGGIAYGLYNAANGEGMTGLYAGVKSAEEATRTKTVKGKDAVIKDNLEAAYKRKGGTP